MAAGDNQRGVPPIIAPRTSSNRPPNAAVTAGERGGSRRTGYTNEDRPARGSRAPSEDSVHTNGADRERGKDDAAAAASAASRARRRQPQQEALPHRPSGGREQPRAGQSSSASRSQPAGTNSPGGLSREASEVLNRLVVSKPEVDLDRERERMAEAVPHSPAAQSGPIGALSIVGSEGVEDGGRGGQRSRHDHTASSKREKNTKFGEYYLGATLGEGEFGKVKMGWKQEGGIQVSLAEIDLGRS